MDKFLSVDVWERQKLSAEEGGLSVRRAKELKRLEVLPGRGITVGMVISARVRKSTLYHFKKSSREELNRDIDDKTIAGYLLSNKRKKEKTERQHAVLEEQELMVSDDEIRDRVEAKIAKYKVSFSVETQNDAFNLEQLCMLEVQVELINEALAPLSMSTQEQRTIDALFDRRDDLLKRHESIEKSMQLDPKGRMAAQGARRAHDVIRDVVDQYRDFLRHHILQVIHCSHMVCWIWHGFPTHPWEMMIMKCPVCGAQFNVPYPEKWKGDAIQQSDFLDTIDLDEIDLMVRKGLFVEGEDGEDGKADIVGVY